MDFPISKAVTLPKKLPPLRKQAENLARSVVKAAKHFVRTGQIKRTPEEIEKIKPICESCPKYLPDEGRCSLCGCYRGFAQWLLTKHCPMDKW